MPLVPIAKTLRSPTYQRYYVYDETSRYPSLDRFTPINYAILRDLNPRAAYDIPPRLGLDYREAFLANDSNFNEVRKLREYPRLVTPPVSGPIQPPTKPFYLFYLTGKGWEIWKLSPEVFDLLRWGSTNHLCVLTAREAFDNEIQSPSPIVFTDAFKHKQGWLQYYIGGDLANHLIFTPIVGIDGTVGYLPLVGISGPRGRYIQFETTADATTYYRDFIYPLVDANTALFLPGPFLAVEPPRTDPFPPPYAFQAIPPIPTILAHYAGLPMNGQVIAPLRVASGRMTLQRKKVRLAIPKFTYSATVIGEETLPPIEAPMVGAGIWALPSDDPTAKLDGVNYYSLQDVGAELVERYTFTFFEPQITIKTPSNTDNCLYVGLASAVTAQPFGHPMYFCSVPNGEVFINSTEAATFYGNDSVFLGSNLVSFGGTTPLSVNFLFYTHYLLYGANHRWVTCVAEGALPPEFKNKDIRVNIALSLWGVLPKAATLKGMTTFFTPSFDSTIAFYNPMSPYHSPRFRLIDLNEQLARAQVVLSLGGMDWVALWDIFNPSSGWRVDMPVGFIEFITRQDLSATDFGRGKEVVKVLVWQPMWATHSFVTDRDYGDILMQFGWKITTIASPPRTEYVTGGIMVGSAWFQNLLRRLRGVDLKDADKQLLRDCVCSLEGFWGAIRVTVHYDRQTGRIYMREWRLGVPYGSPVPLTTFSIQPYHEIRALKDVWAWAFYVDIIDTRTQTIIKRIKVSPTRAGWRVGDVSPSQPIAFTHRKSFVNPLIGVNPSSPYRSDYTPNFHHIVGRSPHTLNSPNLTNINNRIYAYGNYPQRFYPLRTSVENLRGVPQQFKDAAQKVYGSQVPVVPIQFGNLNARPIYVAHIPMVVEVRAKRDVPSEIIAKWGVGVALFTAGDRWVKMFPQGLADLGELLHWAVTEFWESQP